MSEIRTVEEFEACHGVAALPTRLKIIDHIDEGASRWLKASPFGVLACDQKSGFALASVGGQPGFAKAVGERELEIARSAMDDPNALTAGRGVATLFVAPGIGETMRINGVVAATDDSKITISVNECFVHCGKAIIRSQFWEPPQTERPNEGFHAHLAASRFCALATVDAAGRADLSPKGDPAGFLKILPNGDIVLPDRPGNKLADSFHNMLGNPRVAFLAIAPGSPRVTGVTGTARITRDPDVLAMLAVEGQVPKLATLITPSSVMTTDSKALDRAGLWSFPAKADLNASAILVAHIKLNKRAGEQADQIRAGISPGVVQDLLARDYRENLY